MCFFQFYLEDGGIPYMLEQISSLVETVAEIGT
jgi:hypothetical protein